MTEAKEEEILDQQQNPPLSKRKPDREHLADEDVADRKKIKSIIPRNPPPLKETLGVDKEDLKENEEEEVSQEEEDDIDSNGHAAAKKGKSLVRTLDKGKGKMVIVEEEEEEEEGENDDDDDGSSEESGDVIEAGEDEESDFEDDPLAEVDLSNILPSRTRRKAPPMPGAYLVNDQEGDDDDDDDDDDVCH